MIKNKIKAIEIGFLIVCILPTVSQALDKEDILKYLVKSSYPEVKVIDDEGNENNTENDKTTNNEDDKEFVNVYVGEENIPQENESNDKDLKETSSTLNSNYKNDLRVTKDRPQILIYHTHSSETYSDSSKNNYHSTDIEHSVMAVGNVLSTELTEKGWGVVHSTKYNDLSYNEAYAASSKTIESMLSKYYSVKISIDLHRDCQSLKTE